MKTNFIHLFFIALVFIVGTQAVSAQQVTLSKKEEVKKMTSDKKTAVAKKSVTDQEEIAAKTVVPEMKETVNSREEKKEKATSFAVNIVHNSVAGFAPVFLGSREITSKLNLTFYSIYWTNPTFGSVASGGDLFLETGVGLGFHPIKGLFVNPSLGVAHGKFLSGGNHTRVAEGLIPNLFAVYNTDRVEIEGYLAYYKAIQGGPVTKDFRLSWFAPGVKVGKGFALGGYFEQFRLTRISDEGAKPMDIYKWLGGYLKFNFGKGKSVRLAMGKNLGNEAGTGNQFYKISTFIPIH